MTKLKLGRIAREFPGLLCPPSAEWERKNLGRGWRPVSDRELCEAFKRRAQLRHDVASLAGQRRAGRRETVDLVKDGHYLRQGGELLFEERRKDRGHHLTRRCTVRVDHVLEVRGLLQEFFKLGGARHGRNHNRSVRA